MKAKIKQQLCQVPGCKREATGGWQPKGQMKKRIFTCSQCRKEHSNDDFLWKLVGVRKPVKVARPKLVTKNHKPKREGQPAWQKILDGWLVKGKYPVSEFMNLKRWEYWISIGGEKPKGDSRKFKNEEAPIHPLLLHKMNKHKKTKVRRKKSY